MSYACDTVFNGIRITRLVDSLVCRRRRLGVYLRMRRTQYFVFFLYITRV